MWSPSIPYAVCVISSDVRTAYWNLLFSTSGNSNISMCLSTHMAHESPEGLTAIEVIEESEAVLLTVVLCFVTVCTAPPLSPHAQVSSDWEWQSTVEPCP